MMRIVSVPLLIVVVVAAIEVCQGFSPSFTTTHSSRRNNFGRTTRLHINPMDKSPLDLEQELFAQDYDAVTSTVTEKTDDSSGSWEGTSVPLASKPTQSTTTATATSSLEEELEIQQRRNIGVAIASVVFALVTYVWQFTHPVTPIQLLARMEQESAPITSIGSNGKPTVVDFWAPWCDNCKMAAPTLEKIEEEYKGRVNFVSVNSDSPQAWPLIQRFGVDSIPHLALISAEGDVETALIGPIPKPIMEADIDVLLEQSSSTTEEGGRQLLPYVMLDVFANRPDLRRIHFDN
mmetsp:Transcript_10900/g.16834  ORF Transcript_10900/g.16834 Transcript_10900/m.16834 type:complete len:292 (-) Transcript_10900:100-975(-)